MQKRRKTRSKQAPCVKYYNGRGLAEPCPWSTPEQTVPDHWSWSWWEYSKGDYTKYTECVKGVKYRKKERK